MEPAGAAGRVQMTDDRPQTTEVRGRKSEDRRQTTASQMVNLSNSQMVMNGLNEELTI
jgi:hypothetical protein